MGARLEGNVLVELKRRIWESKRKKREILDKLSKLKRKLINKEITEFDFENVVNKKFNDKTPAEWIAYYDWYIAETEKRILIIDQTNRKKKITVASIVAVIFLLGIVIFITAPALIGFVISDNTEKYTDQINVEFNQSQEYVWQVQNPGQLNLVKLSGSITKISPDSSAKVYINDILIFNSENIKKTDSFLTGNVVEDIPSESTPDSSNPDTTSSQESSSESTGGDQTQSPDNILKEAPSDSTSPQTSLPEGAPLENQEEIVVENENITEKLNEIENEIINETHEEDKEELVSFEKICEESCDLEYLNLTENNYTLKIELNDAEIKIESIYYEIIKEEIKIEEEPLVESNITDYNDSVINLVQESAEIGKPVVWKKHIKLDSAGNISIDIPKFAENISAFSLQGESRKNINEKIKEKSETKDVKKPRLNTQGLKENKTIEIEENASEYEIYYETPSPTAREISISENKKEITISGPDELHYTDVLSYTSLPTPLEQKDAYKIKLLWDNNGKLENFPFTTVDSDNDGLIDKIEWTTPHLSNQTFIIILISKAEHLNENRSFIEDIYDYVKTQDNNYTLIPSGDYARVTFEQNLTNQKDITIYARSNSSSTIEVYEKDSNTSIATFENVEEEKLYKIYLTNLSNDDSYSQDTFDLKAIGNVEVDYIVDPQLAGNDTGLVALLHFNNQPSYGENSTYSYDFTGNGNNGTVYGSAVWNQTGGILGTGAYQFDGVDDYISLGMGSTLNLSSQGTVMAWVKIPSDVTLFWNSIISSYDFENDQDGYILSMEGTNGEIYAELSDNNPGYDNFPGDPPLVNDGNWHLTTFTWNGTGGDLYVDGSMVSSGQQTRIPTQVRSTLVGASAIGSGLSFYFNGTIDEVAIYNRSLSAGEISALYNQTSSNSTIYVSNCTNLSVAGTTYVLLNNIDNYPVTCFQIQADNVTLDGNGYYIDGEDLDDTEDYGIYANGRNNMTIKNFANITGFGDVGCDDSCSGAGIGLFETNNSRIINLSLNTNTYGVYLYSSLNNVIENSSVSTSGYGEYGIVLSSSSNNNVISNVNVSTSGDVSVGISLQSSLNNVISNVNVSTSGDYGHGMFFGFSSNNTFSNSFVSTSGSSGYGMYLQSSLNNVISNVNVSTSGSDAYGVYLYSSSDNNTLKDLNINALNNTLGIYIPENGANLTRIINPNIVTNRTAIVDETETSRTNYLIFNNTYGEIAFTNISFLRNLTIMKANLSYPGSIVISNNSVFLNSSYYSGERINSSANITLYGIPNNFVNPKILRDGIECNTTTFPSCYNFTSLNAGTVVFNVSSWSNYSIGGDATDPYALTNCSNLTVAGATYTLQNNIDNYNGTCFNITADNITLDGNGYYIDGDDVGNDYGVFSDGRLNLSIKNFNNLTDFNRAIYLIKTNSSSIYNLVASSNIYGIYLSTSNNNNLSSLTMTNNSQGIYLSYSALNYIFGASLNNNSNTGLSIYSSSNNRFLSITSNYNPSGIYIYFGTNNTLYNISTNSNTNRGIYIESSTNNNLSFVNANYNTNYGIHLPYDSHNTSIFNSTMNSNKIGIEINSCSDIYFQNNYMSNNTESNFYFIGGNYRNNIARDNIVDYNYKIYYNYSLSNYTFDLTTAPDAGTIICANCDNITIKDLNLSHRNAVGVFLYNTTNTNLYNLTSSSNGIFGFYIWASINSTINNVESNNNNFGGIGIRTSSYIKISNITSKSNYDNGLFLHSSANNTFSNILINNTYRGNAIWIGLYTSSFPNFNNTFNNVTIINTNVSYRDMLFTTAIANLTQFIDMPHIGNYSFTGAGGTISVKKTNYGQIEFTSAVNGSGNNFTSAIVIGNNSVFVNSSSNIGLNRSANVTLYGLPTNFVNPKVLKDGFVCTNCYNFTSLNAGTVIFNVSSWSNYSIGENLGSLTSCGDITLGGSYTLMNNVTSNGTCFNILANNVILDGAGYTINYSASGSFGYGVNVTGYNYTTIKNTKIIQGNADPVNAFAINSYGASNGNFTNNTIRTLGYGSYGIMLDVNSDNNSFSNNNFLSMGETGYGAMISYSSNNTISNNLFDNFGQYGYGIYVYRGSNGNNLINNIINTDSYGSYGVYIDSASTSNNNNITGNRINTTAQNAYGIWLDISLNNQIYNNTIITSFYGSYGINLASSSGNTLSANKINTTQSLGFLISGTNSESNNSIDTSNILEGKPVLFNYSINNKVISNVTSSQYGQIICAGCSNVTYDNITMLNGDGISLVNTSNSRVQNSNLTTNNGYGIYLHSYGSYNTLENNTINTNTNFGLFGINLVGESYDNVTRNTIKTDGPFSHAVQLDNNNIILSYNNITTTNDQSYGVSMYGSGNTIIHNFLNILTSSGNSAFGIELSASDNILSNNTIITTGYADIGIHVGSGYVANNNSFSNTSIITSGDNAYSFYIGPNAQNLSILDSKLNSSYLNIPEIYVDSVDSGVWNFTNVTRADGTPINVSWENGVNGTLVNNWYADVNVTNSSGMVNGASVNSTDKNSILRANTFTGSNGLTRQILIEYIRNGTSGSTTTYFSNYNVSASYGGLSNSSSVNMTTNRNVQLSLNAQGSSIISVSSCMDLNTTNGYYQLISNVTSNGTCFNVIANNVTLDGQGFTVNYSANGTLGYGVNVTGYNFTTVKNFIIKEGSLGGTNPQHGINFANSNNGTIINNTVITITPGYSISLKFASSNSNLIISNNITSVGFGYSSYAGSYNNFTGNIVFSSLGYGARIYDFNNEFSLNNITSQNYALQLNAASSNRITNNILNTTSTAVGIYYYGIHITGSNNNTISNNIIGTKSPGASAIYLESSNNNTLTSNLANTISTVSYLLFGTTSAHFNNSIDSSNLAEGKPLSYSFNGNGLTTGDFEEIKTVDSGYTDGLVALYHFNNKSSYGENSTYIVDSADGKYNISTIEKSIWNFSGKLNGAYEFNGINTSMQTPVLELGSEMTFSFWAKFNSWKPDNTYATIISERNCDFANLNGFCVAQSGSFSSGIGFTIANGSIGVVLYRPGVPASLGEWKQYTMVVNQTSLSVYINGIFNMSENNTLTNLNFSNQYYIGGVTGSSSTYLNGSLDEMAFYNRTLSASEILNLYNKQAGDFGQMICAGCNNVTYSGLNLTNGDGISLVNSSNSRVQNSNLTTNKGYGVYVYNNGQGNTVENNTIQTNTNSYLYGIYVSSSSYNNVSGNNVNTTGTNSYSAYIRSSSNNTLMGNRLWSNGSLNWNGVLTLDSGYNNRIIGNSIISNGPVDSIGVLLAATSYYQNDITLDYNNVTTSNSNGLVIYSGSNGLFNNNTLRVSGSATGLSFEGNEQINNNSFRGMNILTSTGYGIVLRKVANLSLIDSIINSTEGVSGLNIYSDCGNNCGTWNFTNVTRADGTPINISWSAGANGTLYMNWYADVNVTNSSGMVNGASVNSSDKDSILSASSMTGSNGLTRQILTEYIRNNTGGSNITYFSNYLINASYGGLSNSSSVNMSTNRNVQLSLNAQGSSIISVSSCQDLNQTNGYYQLISNVTSNGTCFNVIANNVTLDGNGFTVNYSANGTLGYGINVTEYNYTVIKNLRVVEGSLITEGNTALYLVNVNNSKITNNSISTFMGSSYPIELSGNDNNISGNNIWSSASSISGIRFGGLTNDNYIENNIINVTSSYAYGIWFYSTPSNNFIINNTIYSSYSNGYGIYLWTGSDNNLLINNTIVTSGDSGYGIYIDLSSNNTLIGNKVNTTSAISYYFTGTTSSNLNNSIDTSNLAEGKPVLYNFSINNAVISNINSSRYGQIICAWCTNITYNNISMLNSDGIFLVNTSNSRVQNSNLTTDRGPSIYLVSSDRTNITSNFIFSSSRYSGIFSDSSYLYIAHNYIITNNSYVSIYLIPSINSTIFNNTVIVSGDDSWAILDSYGSIGDQIVGNNLTRTGYYGGLLGIYSIGGLYVANNTLNGGIWGGDLDIQSNDNLFVNNDILYGSLVMFLGSTNNTFIDTNIQSLFTPAIYATDNGASDFNFSIKDSIINSSTGIEFSILSTTLDGSIWNFTNVTRPDGTPLNISWASGINGTLNMNWYADVNVTNSSGMVNGASVNSTDKNGILSASSITGSNGLTRQILTEYIRNNTSGSNITYFSNYLINASYGGLSNSSSVNMSTNRNVQLMLSAQSNVISISSCQDLTQSNTIYQLTANVTSNGTCFNVMANGITIDGQGFTVNYSQTEVGHAINNTGFYGVTIKNLNIYEGASIGVDYKETIFFNNTVNSTIQNNSLYLIGYGTRAVVVYGNRTTLTGNLINATGPYSAGAILIGDLLNITENRIYDINVGSYGLSFNFLSSNISILNNIVDSYEYAFAIYSPYNVITNNSFLSRGASSALQFGWSDYNNITNNTIVSLSGSGVTLGYTRYNNFIGNKINTSANIGFVLNGDESYYYNQSIDTSNLAEGKPVLYNYSINNAVISNINYSQYGQIICAWCTNVTYQNVTMLNGDGISLVNSSNSKVQNSNLTSNNGYGVYIYNNGRDNVVENNTIQTNTNSYLYGVYVDSSNYNNVSGNNVKTIAGSYSHAIFYTTASYGMINNNVLNTTGSVADGIGIYYGQSQDIVRDNIIYTSGSSSRDIKLESSNYNQIINNSAFYGLYGLQLGAGSSNNYVANNTVDAWSGILIGGTSSNNNTIKGNSFNGYINYGIDLFDNSHNFTVEDTTLNSSTGEDVYVRNWVVDGGNWNFTNVTRPDGSHINVSWTSGINGTLIMNWYADVNVTNSSGMVNGASVNSTDKNSVLSASSFTASNGLTRQILTEYIRNGTSGSTTTYFSNYLINASYGGLSNSSSVNMSTNRNVQLSLNAQGSSIISVSSCMDLTQSNTIYQLISNVTSNGTCFNVIANNVTLDGNGYTLNYSANGTLGYGVNVTGYNLTTVKNARIVEGTSTNSDKYAFYLITANNVTILNNTITTLGSNGFGIYLAGSKFNNLSNNIISTSGSGVGIFLVSTSNSNYISGNIITTNTVNGIYLSYASYNILTNNQINSSNYIAYSFGGASSSNYNNTIDTTNLAEGKPVLYNFSINNVVISNINSSEYGQIICAWCTNVTYQNVTMLNGDGISLVNSSNSKVQNSNLTSNNGYGVYIYNNGRDNVVENNSISTNTNDFLYAVNVFADYTNISGNTIITFGQDGNGIAITSSYDKIYNNIMNISGGNEASGIRGYTYNSQIYNNIILDAQYAFFALGENTTLTNNTVSCTHYACTILFNLFSKNITLINNRFYQKYSGGGAIMTPQITPGSVALINSYNNTYSSLNYGILIDYSFNGTFNSYSDIINSTSADIYLYTSNRDAILNFTNVTRSNGQNINVSWASGANGTVIMNWFMDVQANYSNGSVVYNTEINSSDKNSVLKGSSFTDSNGLTRQILTEYIRNNTGGSNITYFSNYLINATDINDWKYVNMSANRNVQLISGALGRTDTIYPLIDFTGNTPTNSTSTTNNSVAINVSINEENLENLNYSFDGINYSLYDDSLVLMMNFDNRTEFGENDTRVIDLSKYGNNGTVVGGATLNSNGKYSGAYQFDGTDDYVKVLDSESINPSEITLSSWVKTNSTDGYVIAKDPIALRQAYSAYALGVGGVSVVEDDLIVVMYSGYTGNLNDMICSDNAAGGTNNYNNVTGINAGTGQAVHAKMFYAIAKASETLTVSCSGINDPGLSVHVYSGIDTANPLDTNGTRDEPPSSTTHTSNSITTAESDNEVIVAFFAEEAQVSSYSGWTNSFNEQTEQAGHSHTTADRIVNSKGTYSTEMTSTSSTNGVWIMASFNQKPTNKTIVPYALSTVNGGQFLIKNESNTYTVNSSASVTDNNWHYLTATYNKSSMKIYVDGILTGSQTGLTGNLPVLAGDLRIGADYDVVPDNFFNGSIDETRIWNRSLSDDEIKEQYMMNLQKFNFTQWYLQVNQSKNTTTGLDAGSYNYFACARDTSGNSNCTETRNINIQSPTSAPLITSVSSISAVDLVEAGSKAVVINFTAYDSNGYGDLKTSAMLNVSKSGEVTRYNNSCSQVSTYGTYYANYSCTVYMQYYDGYGTWNIGVGVNDSSDLVGYNTTSVFSVNQLTAFVSSPSAITFGALNPGSINTTSNNDPITLNNTGNDPIALGSIEINATDLIGESDSSKGLYAGNFSVAAFGNSGTIECNTTATTMNRSVYTSINGALLPNGNFSINNGTSGQEQLYVCLRIAGSDISSQSYSTASGGSWTIRILAVLVGLKGIKKRKRDKNNLLKALGLVLIELKGEYSEDKAKISSLLIKELREKYRYNREEILVEVPETRVSSVPVEIFSSTLGPLESICKYLKENAMMNYKEISEILKRDERTIWNSYNRSAKKYDSFIITESKMMIPIEIFASDKLTVFESLILYLKSQNMSFAEIGAILNRNQRNVWTIHSNANKKTSK